MRKTLSIILTAAMLLSVLAAIPFSAGAESAAVLGTTKIGFESEEERKFHDSKSAYFTWENVQDHGYVAALNGICASGRSPQWPSVIRISQKSDDGSVTAAKVRPGGTYTLNFKIHIDKLFHYTAATDDKPESTEIVDIKNIYLVFLSEQNRSGSFLNNNKLDNWTQKKTLDIKLDNDAMRNGWVSYSCSFEAPSNLGQFTEMGIVISGSRWNTPNNCSVYIDDIEITQATNILTVHTSASETKTITAKCDADLSTINVNMAGARFKGLYLDAALTKPATGAVGYEARELWAAFESFTGDFENGNALAGTLYDGGYSVLPYVGVDNSSALTDYKEGGTPGSNSAWPPVLKLLNTDGSDFLTYSGHEYLISFDMKVDNPSLIPERAALALVYSKPAYPTDGNFTTTYPLLDNESYTESKVPIKYGYKNSDDTYGTTGWYKHYEFHIEGLDNGLPVYITPWQALTFTYFDNFKIIDLTAQIAVTDDDGNELAKGYAGDSVSVPAADGNFICYEKSGEAVTNVTINYSDNKLSKVTSQIAVTETAADTENKTISFKAGFEGIEYTAGDENITVKNAIIDGERYGIAEIGLLVLPDEKLSGDLTLKNYEALGAKKLSNSDLKYSAAADNRLEVTAVINTDNFNRDYTVVGYIKCANGRVLYSKTRYGINRNLAAAAGLDSIADNAAYEKYGYTLASNSEFNSADKADIFKNWNIWGHSRTTDGVTVYSTTDTVSADGKNMVMTVTRDSDSAFRIPYMLSKLNFTTGYLEVRAKFSDFSGIGGCIWLNSAGISETEYKYPSNDTDKYVHPELDIVEFSNNTKFDSTLHSWGSDGSQRDQIRLNPLSDSSADNMSLSLNEWHTYGFERTADAIKTYVDGELVYEYTLEQALKDCRENKKEGSYLYRTENEVKALFENPTYLILSLSADTLETGESTESLIDYVRFYK